MMCTLNNVLMYVEAGYMPSFFFKNYTDNSQPLTKVIRAESEGRSNRTGFLSIVVCLVVIIPLYVALITTMSTDVEWIKIVSVLPGGFIVLLALWAMVLGLRWNDSVKDVKCFETSGFGKDFGLLTNYFHPIGNKSEAEFRAHVEGSLRMLTSNLRDKETGFISGTDPNRAEDEIKNARSNFREAFSVAAKFRLVNSKAGWKPFFQDPKEQNSA